MISALEKLTWPKRYSAGAALAAATLALQRSGTEVARRIRVTAAGRNARLVASTGWGQSAGRASTAAAGFDCHLSKPVKAAVLRRLLARPALKTGSA